MFFPRWIHFFLLSFRFSLFNFTPINNNQLDQFLKHYEQINNPHVTMRNGKNVKLQFRAFGREFDLTLVYGSRILDANAKFVIYGLNSSKSIHSSDINRHLVTGYVEGHNDSSVIGYIFNGIFVGIIKIELDIYYVERAKDFLPQPINFDSIIYRFSDVNITDNAKDYNFVTSTSKSVFKTRRKRDNQKRSSYKTSANICTLRIIVDHVFCEKSPMLYLERIISYIGTLIKEVDNIYRKTDFDDDGDPDDIGFKISEILILWNKNQKGYPFKDTWLSSEKYVELLRELDDNDDVCLVLAITGRPMLGFISLSPVRNRSTEGICAKRNKTTGNYHNVALVTLFPYEVRLANAIAVVVIAREIGHAFGSDVDPDTKECNPTLGGNYIMHRQLPTELEKNSHTFSPCSVRQINEKLKELGNKCFLTSAEFKSCGNGLRDTDEEDCDCGNPSKCADIDYCCTPAGEPDECKYSFANGSECSYRNNACCTKMCKIVHADIKLWCNRLEYCRIPSHCDGKGEDCPPSPGFELDGVECREGIGHCQKGYCIADGCRDNNAEECLSSDVENSCYLSCRKGDTCLPAHKWGILNEDGSKIVLPDGEPCWGVASYCYSGICKHMADLGDPKPWNMAFNNEPADRPLNYIVIVFTILFIIVVSLLVATFVYGCLPP